MKFFIAGTRYKKNFQFDGEFEPNSSIALIGESGAGKTTLLRFLSGFERNRQSWISSEGVKNTPSWQSGVCLVHQQPTMFRHHTVAQTLAFAQNYRPAKINFPLESWLDQLELREVLDQPTVNLSGGQQQRVAVLRAMLSSPLWLLLDESFSALDDKRLLNACAVLEEFRALTNVGLIIASHNAVAQRYLCDRAFVVENMTGRMATNVFEALDSHQHSLIMTTLMAQVVQVENSFLQVLVDDQVVYVRPPQKWQPDYARVSFLAKDISLATNESHQTSMVNRVCGTVHAVEEIDQDNVLVYVQLKEQKIRSIISSWSWHRLGLQIGQRVFAEFKVGAVQWHGQQPML